MKSKLIFCVVTLIMVSHGHGRNASFSQSTAKPADRVVIKKSLAKTMPPLYRIKNPEQELKAAVDSSAALVERFGHIVEKTAIVNEEAEQNKQALYRQGVLIDRIISNTKTIEANHEVQKKKSSYILQQEPIHININFEFSYPDTVYVPRDNWLKRLFK